MQALNTEGVSVETIQTAPAHTGVGLQRGVLSPLETLAQSIAGIAPSATPGMLIPIVFSFAGNGSWLSYLLATVGILFTARCINEFASRSACPGSLYSFVNQSMGRKAGMLTGWALLFAYIFCGAACVVEFALYAGSLIKHSLHLEISSQLMMLVSSLTVGFVAYKNVKLSASLMLKLEILSVGLILLVVGLTLWQHGISPDWQQLSLQGVKFENVRMGLVMAIFGFVAFESAASLGTEAKEPLRTIPRAIMQSVIFSGAFFMVSSYAMVMSFHGSSIPLDKCSTPLLSMSSIVGVPLLGHIIDAGIMVSFFAAGLANLNAGARALFKMSHDGLLHNRFSNCHSENQTPHVAVWISSAISLTIAVLLSTLNTTLMDIVGWLGTLATFGFIYAYMATSISAAKLLKEQNQLSFLKASTVCASAAVLVFALVGSLYPLPAFPYNILPLIFSAYMMVGVLYLRRLRLNS
ncbi:MAG TPA: APC family permease [Candidatus Melainabacteria bacterium]|nr:APC family permease [Candidatus Melainabacteria bacterium]